MHISSVQYRPPQGNWDMMPHMWTMMGPGMFLMGLFWLVLLVVMVLLAVWLYRNLSQGSVSSRETPLDTLKRRYARGEINQDEYDRIRRDIA